MSRVGDGGWEGGYSNNINRPLVHPPSDVIHEWKPSWDRAGGARHAQPTGSVCEHAHAALVSRV